MLKRLLKLPSTNKRSISLSQGISVSTLLLLYCVSGEDGKVDTSLLSLVVIYVVRFPGLLAKYSCQSGLPSLVIIHFLVVIDNHKYIYPAPRMRLLLLV